MIDQGTVTSVLLVLLFIVVGGVFAGTEIALVSLRATQIAKLEDRGGRGARVAAVARDPNRFLAAVQIGVTFAGLLSAAYGASTIAPELAPHIERLGASEGVAEATALVALTIGIAYLSLVFGELVPKRLALQRAAGFALVVGPPLDRFATAMRPVIWLLSRSTNAVVKLLGGDPHATTEEISGDELRSLLDTHEDLSADERRIVADVFDAGNRTLAEAMRPRADMVMLSADDTVATAFDLTSDHPYSRYPVAGENFDDIVGFIHVRDLVGTDGAVILGDLARPMPFLPSTNRVIPTLTRMRAEGTHIGVVVDEYGGTDGLVTLEDLVEELIGDIQDEFDVAVPATPEADSDSWVDAGLTIEEFSEKTGVELADGPYETAAGYVLRRLGRVAEVGDVVEAADQELVVAEVDGHRITRIAVRRAPA
jgi:putative hemolysin